MRNLTDIKSRIKGVSDTRQITSAMETISVAKMHKAHQRYEANKQYFDKIRAVIKDIITRTKDVTHRYIAEKRGGRAVFIVIASDKGLAGGYNHNVLNKAWELMSEYSERYIFTVGQVAREFFEHKKAVVDVEFTHATRDPTIRDAAEIADSIINLYDQGLMDEVYIVYTEPETGAAAVARSMKLLPLSKETVIGGIEDAPYKNEDYYREIYYDPSPEAVLNELVPQYLIGVIYSALIQSVAAEHSSRMAAMSSASRNATELLEKLRLEYNRARQESVTNELIEIVTSSFGTENRTATER
ncbi:MAG: ATP synthase F1 subunit gamma [Clostridiales bacterium]|jgi:F-type H+-transporting ATPase subunit gamma|nr:ATP synthase F1 subunit gamma [Clostridiales bacterium]